MRILYLDLDTLRPDHLGCYGYHRNTSPAIDKIAKEGVRFDNYFCADAPCLPSRTSLMTGTFGIHHGCVNHSGEHADLRLQRESRLFRSHIGLNSLPAILRDNVGLHTTYIGGFPERHGAHHFNAGFRESIDTGMGGMESAEHVTPTVLDWIERNASDDDWYLHANYWDAHTPYRAPKEFGNAFEDSPIDDFYTEELIHRHRKQPGPHTLQDINMWDDGTRPQYPRAPGSVKNLEEMKDLIDGYDNGIRYMDSHLEQLFAALEQKGVMDDLIVIISADHGENFGELGLYAEHATADVATCRIPMIIRWPGKQQGHVDSGFHYNIDLLPTLADMLGAKPHEIWDGQSFADVINTGQKSGRDELVVSQMSHVCQRSVRWDDWLYVRTWHDGYHLFPQDMLFNIKEDPREQHNLADECPEIRNEGVRRLMNWTDRQMVSMPWGYVCDPLWEVLAEGGPAHARIDTNKRVERLKETGRGEYVEETLERHKPVLKYTI